MAHPGIDVIRQLLGTRSTEAVDLLERRANLAALAGSEKNPEVLAGIIASLAPWTDYDVRPFLDRRSYRERVASAALATLRARDDGADVAALIRRLKDSALEFRSSDYAAGMDAVAFLARRHERKDDVRSFLAAHLVHPREKYRQAAARSLGTLGDSGALALLRAAL